MAGLMQREMGRRVRGQRSGSNIPGRGGEVRLAALPPAGADRCAQQNTTHIRTYRPPSARERRPPRTPRPPTPPPRSTLTPQPPPPAPTRVPSQRSLPGLNFMAKDGAGGVSLGTQRRATAAVRAAAVPPSPSLLYYTSIVYTATVSPYITPYYSDFSMQRTAERPERIGGYLYKRRTAPALQSPDESDQLILQFLQ